MRIGEAVRIKRVTKGYSQEYVGKQLGIDQTGVSRIETGKADPPFGLLNQFSVIAQCSLHDFAVCEPPPPLDLDCYQLVPSPSPPERAGWSAGRAGGCISPSPPGRAGWGAGRAGVWCRAGGVPAVPLLLTVISKAAARLSLGKGSGPAEWPSVWGLRPTPH